MNERRAEQRKVTIDQFTRQASGFRKFAETLGKPRDIVLAATKVDQEDTVLDVACGPGVTTCDFAQVARQATGIDVTPAMIEQARQLQSARKLTNVAWQVAAVPPLPFADDTFSLVFTRYSFHHLPDPRAVLKEMQRVCTHTGRVAVVDVYMDSTAQADAYNYMERLRDPSHVRALLLAELTESFASLGLALSQRVFYKQEVSLGPLLERSFPGPGNAERIRKILADDVDKNKLGLGVHWRGGDIHFAFPIVVLVGR